VYVKIGTYHGVNNFYGKIYGYLVAKDGKVLVGLLCGKRGADALENNRARPRTTEKNGTGAS
jgi:hypothetical protein